MSTIEMDMDSDHVPIQMEERRPATILCYRCGAAIDGTTAAGAICYDCIKMTVDITQGIPREAHIQFCRDCDRWMMPPNLWVVAQPESREMLSMCLKRLRGINKVRVIDARFIWTEPNSRRIRVKITVQDTIGEGMLLNQSFEVIYVVGTHQCPECAKSYTHNVWRATVQVRQKVPHKRTFLFLEQLILKHGAHRDTLNIKEARDGLDFFFQHRNQAVKFLDFLKSVVPVTAKTSDEMISEDIHTGTKSMKFAFSVELVPICKDDLVALPLQMANKVGHIHPIALCHRIGTSINLLDPTTLQTAEISAPVYWREKFPFQPLADSKELVEFIVLEIEPTGPRKGRWVPAEATVTRASDAGSSSYFTRTHLGGLLNAGDSVMGYLLTGSNYNNVQFDEIQESHAYGSTVPEVILVKKHYPNRRKNRTRKWKLKRMAKEEGDLLPKKTDQDRMENEYEEFLRDIEEDEELRAALTLYKNPKQQAELDAARSLAAATSTTMAVDAEDGEPVEEEGSDVDEDEDGPQINLDELVDELDELNIAEAE